MRPGQFVGQAGSRFSCSGAGRSDPAGGRPAPGHSERHPPARQVSVGETPTVAALTARRYRPNLTVPPRFVHDRPLCRVGSDSVLVVFSY